MRWTAAAWSATLGLAVTFSTLSPALASHQAYYDPGAARRQAGEAAGGMQTDFWNSLTPEQQAIHRTVTQIYTLYFERQGEVIPVNPETVALVMKELGIAAEYAEWTAYVMHVNVQRLRTPRQAESVTGAPRHPRP